MPCQSAEDNSLPFLQDLIYPNDSPEDIACFCRILKQAVEAMFVLIQVDNQSELRDTEENEDSEDKRQGSFRDGSCEQVVVDQILDVLPPMGTADNNDSALQGSQ